MPACLGDQIDTRGRKEERKERTKKQKYHLFYAANSLKRTHHDRSGVQELS